MTALPEKLDTLVQAKRVDVKCKEHDPNQDWDGVMGPPQRA